MNIKLCLVSFKQRVWPMQRFFWNETYDRVRVGKHLCGTFPIKNGLKEGDALSPLLFKFALDMPLGVLRQIRRVCNRMLHIGVWLLEINGDKT